MPTATELDSPWFEISSDTWKLPEPWPAPPPLLHLALSRIELSIPDANLGWNENVELFIEFPCEFNSLSTHDVKSCHAVIKKGPGRLVTSCCSSGLTQHLLTLFQYFTRVEWILSTLNHFCINLVVIVYQDRIIGLGVSVLITDHEVGGFCSTILNVDLV